MNTSVSSGAEGRRIKVLREYNLLDTGPDGALDDLENCPKVILLDLKLPKVDGLEVLQRLKSDERTKAIPVIVLTSSKEQIDVSGCYQRGVNSYIVKPVNFEGFAKAVRELGLYWVLLNHAPKTEQ